MILEDYSRDAVLERLLRTERRIEGSLCRMLNELRRVHDQGRKADLEAANTLDRWREEDDRSRKERALALSRPPDRPSRPDGGTTDTPEEVSSWKCQASSEESQGSSPPGLETSHFTLQTAGRQLCETNPICEGIGIQGSGVSSLKPDPRPLTPELLCETNPICPEPDASQVQCGTEVRSDSAPDRLRKTKPISDAPRGTGILPVNPDHGRDAHTTHGQDAHATEVPDWGSTNRPVGQSCETNPICVEPDESQVLCGTAVRSDSAPNGLRQTNPMCDSVAFGVPPSGGKDWFDPRKRGTPNGYGRLCKDGHAPHTGTMVESRRVG